MWLQAALITSTEISSRDRKKNGLFFINEYFIKQSTMQVEKAARLSKSKFFIKTRRQFQKSKNTVNF
jgi:hypothetical protein